jgi:hypothetical protein
MSGICRSGDSQKCKSRGSKLFHFLRPNSSHFDIQSDALSASTLQRSRSEKRRFSPENRYLRIPAAADATFCNVFRFLYQIHAKAIGWSKWNSFGCVYLTQSQIFALISLCVKYKIRSWQMQIQNGIGPNSKNPVLWQKFQWPARMKPVPLNSLNINAGETPRAAFTADQLPSTR